MTRPTLIGLDADDTRWPNQTLGRRLQARVDALLQPRVDAPLQPWADPPVVAHRRAAGARRKLAIDGYAAKGGTPPMRETVLETAIALSNAQVPTPVRVRVRMRMRSRMRMRMRQGADDVTGGQR